STVAMQHSPLDLWNRTDRPSVKQKNWRCAWSCTEVLRDPQTPTAKPCSAPAVVRACARSVFVEQCRFQTQKSRVFPGCAIITRLLERLTRQPRLPGSPYCLDFSR